MDAEPAKIIYILDGGHNSSTLLDLIFNVHGNPMRYRRIEAIRRDMAWMRLFSPAKKIMPTIILYPFNRHWVYPRD